MKFGPLSVQCDEHHAPIGVPCEPSGTCCSKRITRALFIAQGVTVSHESVAVIGSRYPKKGTPS